MNTIGISVIAGRAHVTLLAEDILYIVISGKKTVIHAAGDRIYETYTPIGELAQALGSSFIRVDRGCLVSAKAIHAVTRTIDLINGEALDFAYRRKREITEQLRVERQRIVQTLERESAPATREDYHRHYAAFDQMPFAFADIEMVFSEKHSAVDWIFRYGNPALAKLEKLPLEVMDHSPEINVWLKVICFPTFPGHCGCILFDLSDLAYTRISGQSSQAMLRYFGRTQGGDSVL